MYARVVSLLSTIRALRCLTTVIEPELVAMVNMVTHQARYQQMARHRV